METGNKRDDKKAFFDTFSKDNGTDKLPFPRNRIIFGAPGTGKSHKLKEDSEQFENQEPIESDEKDIIKQEIIEANELNDKLFSPGMNSFAFSSTLGFHIQNS